MSMTAGSNNVVAGAAHRWLHDVQLHGLPDLFLWEHQDLHLVHVLAVEGWYCVNAATRYCSFPWYAKDSSSSLLQIIHVTDTCDMSSF